MPPKTARQIAAITGLAAMAAAVVVSAVLTGLHEPESVAFVGPMAGAAAFLLMVLGIIKTRGEADAVAVSLLRRLIDRASDDTWATVLFLAVCAMFAKGATWLGCDAIGQHLVACDKADLIEWGTWRGATRTPACEPGKTLTIAYWLPFNGGKPPAITCVFPGVARGLAQPAPGGGSLCGSAPQEPLGSIIKGRVDCTGGGDLSNVRVALLDEQRSLISRANAEWTLDSRNSFIILTSEGKEATTLSVLELESCVTPREFVLSKVAAQRGFAFQADCGCLTPH